MRDVIEAVLSRLSEGDEALLCQVVETKGSTPQKAGALMLIDPLGRQVGTLGGGCVEAEVKQKATRLLGERSAELFSFVLDHDQAWADGLVCGGKMTVVAEAFRGEAAHAYFAAMLERMDGGAGFTEAVRLRPIDGDALSVGGRWLIDATGQTVASHRASAAHEPRGVIFEGDKPRRPSVVEGVALLPVAPRVRLVIVGAGHVGQAVAALAGQVDFDVWVIDDRAAFANRERFPSAQKLIVGPIEQSIDALAVDPFTYILIVTRGHGHDQEALLHAAPTAAGYVGLIGSKRKIRMILDALRRAGVSEQALERVTAPVGVDIGSQTVAEIAVSIVAQLIARRNLGKPLATAS
jgi:xanthine dehydrogenase accessory factor